MCAIAVCAQIKQALQALQIYLFIYMSFNDRSKRIMINKHMLTNNIDIKLQT